MKFLLSIVWARHIFTFKVKTMVYTRYCSMNFLAYIVDNELPLDQIEKYPAIDIVLPKIIFIT